MHSKIEAALLAENGCPYIDNIFDKVRRKRIERSANLWPVVLTPANFPRYREQARKVEVLFTCWGIPHELLTLENFPALRAVFYSGGSVKGSARPRLERGIPVAGARAANAVTAAPFCLGQISLS